MNTDKQMTNCDKKIKLISFHTFPKRNEKSRNRNRNCKYKWYKNTIISSLRQHFWYFSIDIIQVQLIRINVDYNQSCFYHIGIKYNAIVQKNLHFCIKFSNKHKLCCSNIYNISTVYILWNQVDRHTIPFNFYTYILFSQPICLYNINWFLLHHVLLIDIISFVKHLQIYKMTLSPNNSTCIRIFNSFALI